MPTCSAWHKEGAVQICPACLPCAQGPCQSASFLASLRRARANPLSFGILVQGTCTPALRVFIARGPCLTSCERLRLGNFHHGGGNRLRRPAIVVSGVPKKRSQPETVGNFHHGHASSLRRPSIFANAGAQSLRLSSFFSMGISWACKPRETSCHFRERLAQKLLRA